MSSNDVLFVKNPHTVALALKNRPKDVLRISVPSGAQSGTLGDGWDPVLETAKRLKIPLQGKSAGGSAARDSGREHGRDNNRENFKDGRTQSPEAQIKPKQAVSVEELFEEVPPSGLWIALDCLQDPHNVGAIFRAAAFFGVKGIILTQERSAPMTATVYDVSCGGVEAVPFAIIPNLQRAFEKAKDAGLWILGTSEHAHDSISTISKDRPWLLVLGNEEKGLRRLTEESCDMLCKIPAKGDVQSLNVSVAAGIFISSLT